MSAWWLCSFVVDDDDDDAASFFAGATFGSAILCCCAAQRPTSTSLRYRPTAASCARRKLQTRRVKRHRFVVLRAARTTLSNGTTHVTKEGVPCLREASLKIKYIRRQPRQAMSSEPPTKELSFKNVIWVKQTGGSFAKDQIDWLIESAMRGSIDHAQVGALLMAIYLKGMTIEETTNLTNAFINSGDKLTWPSSWPRAQVVDKHSTGGVGDKISLPLVASLIALDMKVPMISGRSLGHTGGTLDKLESIPGFNVNLSASEMLVVLDTVGGCIVSQTASLVPADKLLYAARDITGTVASLPLIVSSIISKKAVEGIGALVLDVKTGSGAFLKTLKDAEELAVTMVSACQCLGIKSVALLTDMNSPLGRTVGNSLEVMESIKVMKGRGPQDVEELVCLQAAHLLLMSAKVETVKQGIEAVKEKLKNGEALDAFKRMIVAQGVQPALASRLCYNETFTDLPLARYTTQFRAPTSGVVAGIDPLACAMVSGSLGAGRAVSTDVIDHGVGIELNVQLGGRIECEQVWAVVHHSIETLPPTLSEAVAGALVVSTEKHSSSCPTRLIKVIA